MAKTETNRHWRAIKRTTYHRHSLPHIPRQTEKKLLTFSEAEDEDKGKEAAKGGIYVR